jgi:hypothetical protein
MKIYLASIETQKHLEKMLNKPLFVLESFYSLRNGSWMIKYIKNKIIKDFMLDSGAFTFMENKTVKTNWLAYIRDYAYFINKYGIDKFYELDVDTVIGCKKTLELRKRLEKMTKKKCIPVWHKIRGKQNFIDMCKEYNYVAIGGIVTGEIKPEEYRYFHWFINQAHNNNAKIHALGFTNIDGLKKYKFDSVDSTAWIGSRWGRLYYFNGYEIRAEKKQNQRTVNYKRLDVFNFKEWIKFQKYADKYL